MNTRSSMPTYEYRCAAGHEFEQFQRMTEPPLETCPQCGAAAERLLSTGAGLLFKGSGFYITDYRSESYKKAAKAEKSAGESKSSESKSSDTKSESKSSGNASEAKPAPAKSASGGKSDS
jgi:putative FmdB family regulatory protein